MAAKDEIFDTAKAKATIEKGRRARWLRRIGTPAKGFAYEDADGRSINQSKELDRIKALVIPPAWKNVRINPGATGKIQVVGMDTTGRVQYLYHPKFSERQQRLKFAKVKAFGEALPKLIETTNRDISQDGLPVRKVLAVVMRLINSLYFRVGSDLSATHYKTYGITTLQKKHLVVGRKGRLTFNFVGKSHVEHRKVLVDEELAGVIKQLLSIGRGRLLFRYLDDSGKARPIKPSQINAYIKEATDSNFSSKDFRTWGATLLAAVALAERGCCDSEKERKKAVVNAVKSVAEELGNTPSVCRGSYIHPYVLKAYEQGKTLDEFLPRKQRKMKRLRVDQLPEETALIRLLKSCE